MVPKLSKVNTGYLDKGDAAVQLAAQKAATASASDIMFRELADTKIDQTPMPTTTGPLGASDTSQGYQPSACQGDSSQRGASTTPSTSQAETLKVPAEVLSARSQKLRCNELPVRVKTSSTSLMRTELNKLQRALCQGLISLDDLAFRSTSAKGDFIIRNMPVHHDNPTKASRCARLSTTKTSTMTTSAETTSNTTGVPPKGAPHLVSPAEPAGSDKSTSCDLGSKGQKPQETNFAPLSLAVTNSNDEEVNPTDPPKSVRTNEWESRVETYYSHDLRAEQSKVESLKDKTQETLM